MVLLLTTAAALSSELQTLQRTLYQIDQQIDESYWILYDGESHFKLTIASDAFIVKRLVARHQLVYSW
jgi:BolA protein